SGVEAAEAEIERLDGIATLEATVKKPSLAAGQLDIERLQDFGRDLVLYGEAVLEDPVVSLGPGDAPGRDVGQLDGNAHPVPRPLHRSAEDVSDAHLPPGLLGCHIRGAKPADRRRRNQKQTG